MALNRRDRLLRELIGIGLYAPFPDQIRETSYRAIRFGDPWIARAGIENVGHLARRFGIVDWQLLAMARRVAGQRQMHNPVVFALENAVNDCRFFMPHRVRRRAYRDRRDAVA